jgi:hypothetical protein
LLRDPLSWPCAHASLARTGARKWRIMLRKSLDNELVSHSTVQNAAICPKTAPLLTLG